VARKLDYHLRMTITETGPLFERGEGTGEADQGRRPFQWERAAEFLREALADGPRLSRELVEEAKAEGITRENVYSAATRLSLQRDRSKGASTWSLAVPQGGPSE